MWSDNTTNKIVMFSFTIYPFWCSAKDYLNVKIITYETIELDEIDGNNGNIVRASSGKITGRISVPIVFSYAGHRLVD